MFRNEYPRPNLVRPNWLNLNGEWQFAFDDDNVGIKEKWYENSDFALTIHVPFAFQTQLSGINRQEFHDYVWYKKIFTVQKMQNKRYILHFQAVDYECKIFLNHKEIGHHIGGQAPFCFDITDHLTFANEELVLWVYDPSTDVYLPRGKQYWKEKPEIIWYNRTTGIWQSVWLEIVNERYITDVKITSLYDQGEVEIVVTTNSSGHPLTLNIANGHMIKTAKVINNNHTFTVKVFNSPQDYQDKSWSPNNPYLFNFSLQYDEDVLTSYFGMRKVHAHQGKTYLNNQPYYFKLILDQGYWPESLLTAPTVEALKKDIELAKAMGFNGARKHQKCEDPYFAYYADHLGYLIWGEMASSVQFNETSAWRDLNEWKQIIKRDYNHPSIVAWVPLNESWGVPDIATDRRQQQHALDLYALIRAQDQTRFIVGNDGWEQVKTDLCAIHNYNHGKSDDLAAQQAFKASISTREALISSRPANRPIYAHGYTHQGEPILLTEFGGISYKVSGDGWGYTAVNDGEVLLSEYKRIILDIKDSKALFGYCYTQLTDVEQEINGLLTYDRKPKVPLDKIRAINDLIDD